MGMGKYKTLRSTSNLPTTEKKVHRLKQTTVEIIQPVNLGLHKSPNLFLNARNPTLHTLPELQELADLKP